MGKTNSTTGIATAAAVAGLLILHNDAPLLSFLAGHPLAGAPGFGTAFGLYILIPLLFTFLIVWSAWGIGLGILRRIGISAETLLEHIFASAIGIETLGLGLLAIGLAHGFYPVALAAYGIVCVVASAAACKGRFSVRQPARRSTEKQNALPSAIPLRAWLLLGLVGYGVWHAVVVALAPPLEFDALSYHLAIGKIYAQSHRLVEIPWMLHSHQPHLMELLYTWPLSFRIASVPALLHMGLVVLLGLAVFGVAKDEMGPEAAYWSAGLFAAQPLLVGYAGTPHSDGAWAFFSFMCLYAAWRATQPSDKRWLYVSAIAAGAAMSCKYLGPLMPAVALGWIALQASRKRCPWSFGGMFAFIAGALSAPWYIRAWMATGNPVWPFASAVFGDHHGSRAIEKAVVAINYQPWSALWTQAGDYSGGLTLAFFALAVVVSLLYRRQWPRILPFLFVPLVPFIVVVAHIIYRYLWPLLPFMSLVEGYAMSCLWQRSRAGKAAAAAVLVAVGLLLSTTNENNALRADLNIRSRSTRLSPREEFRERLLDIASFYRAIDAQVGPQGKVLLFQETRGYDLNVPYQWGDPVMQGVIAYRAMRDGDELTQALRNQGITHVFVNAGSPNFQPLAGYYDDPVLAVMRDAMRRHGRLAAQFGRSMWLFALTRDPRAAVPSPKSPQKP
ncbi:MAG TPA: glycosyltransferase family 39 protein [Elusimicrobiota bacterium]|nr:glycosyltransferase family 39 protein [Elusimicrobiota bacterium]